MTAALPSPIVHEDIMTAPAGAVWSLGMRTACGHLLAPRETYLRLEDGHGNVWRFCSSCMLRVQAGARPRLTVVPR